MGTKKKSVHLQFECGVRLSVTSWLGVYYFAESERTYEGTFSQNLFEGKGKLTYKDGKSYDGDFV